jgi:hypothetical protein
MMHCDHRIWAASRSHRIGSGAWKVEELRQRHIRATDVEILAIRKEFCDVGAPPRRRAHGSPEKNGDKQWGYFVATKCVR